MGYQEKQTLPKDLASFSTERVGSFSYIKVANHARQKYDIIVFGGKYKFKECKLKGVDCDD